MSDMDFYGEGSSLWPAVKSGALLKIDPKPPGLSELGVFLGPKGLCCHRVLARHRNRDTTWYLFKGDGNWRTDGWVPRYRILGKVNVIDGISPRAEARWFAWLISLFNLPSATLFLRKNLGLLFFRFLFTPAGKLSDKNRCPADYGLAEFHDAIIIRDSSDFAAIQNRLRSRERILDLGGGSGRMAIPLARSGFTVTVLDPSKAMLEKLNGRRALLSTDEKARLTIMNGRGESLPVLGEFDVALLLNNVLEHLPSRSAILQMLRNIHTQLKPTAWVALDVHQSEYFARVPNIHWQYLADKRLNGQRIRLWSRRKNTSQGCVVQHAVYSSSEGWRWTEVSLKLRSPAEWKCLFEEAGFLVSEMSGDWTGRSLGRPQPKLIFFLRPIVKPTN